MPMKYVYVMISQTQTGYAKLIRKVGKVIYNHASISLDEEFSELYAFARTEQYGYLVAKLVRETTDRYLVNSESGAPVKIFKVPVTEEQYDAIRDRIYEVLNDPEYKYNLFSVLTYPLFKGFATYKAYTCIEFVMHLLEPIMSHPLDKPIFRYKPDDLLDLLGEYAFFEGNLLDYMKEYTSSENYFSGVSLKLVRNSAKAFASIAYRTAVVASISLITRLYELPLDEIFPDL